MRGVPVTTRQLHDELIIGMHPVLGVKTAYVLPVIPDNAPYMVREGLARRRITAMTGQCPCGAVMDTGDLQAGAITNVAVEHEDGCPAITTKLAKAVRRWMR